MREMNIEFDLDGEQSHRREYVNCLEQAAVYIEREGLWWKIQNLTFVFTNKIERANRPRGSDEVVFFISDKKSEQSAVINPETVVPRGGLHELPGALYLGIKNLYHAAAA
jgi:hypothetical protein